MSRHPVGVANEAELIRLAEQGDPRAIAAIMNYYFNAQRIEIKVGWEKQRLLILAEANPAPQQDILLHPLERILAQLKLKTLQAITLYGRTTGDVDPAWTVEIQIKQPSASIAPTRPSALTAAPAASEANGANSGIAKSQGPLVLNSRSQSRPSYPSTQGKPEPVPQNQAGNQRDRFLRFACSRAGVDQWETALLPLHQIQEILYIPATSILPVPYMAPCVLGICNYRGYMLWMVDLMQQLGDRSFLSHRQTREPLATIVVHRDDGELMGLVVPQVLDIESYAPEHLQEPDPNLFPETVLPFVYRYLPQNLSLVLNIQGLMQDTKLQRYGAHPLL